MLVSSVEKWAEGAEARKGITPWLQIKSSQGAPGARQCTPPGFLRRRLARPFPAWRGSSRHPGAGRVVLSAASPQPELAVSLPHLRMSRSLTGRCLVAGEEEKLVF